MGWDLDNLNFLLLYDERFSRERAICIDFSTLFRRYGVTFKKWPSFQPLQNQQFKWLKRKPPVFIWGDIYAASCFLFHQNNTKIDEMVAILEKVVFVTENVKSVADPRGGPRGHVTPPCHHKRGHSVFVTPPITFHLHLYYQYINFVKKNVKTCLVEKWIHILECTSIDIVSIFMLVFRIFLLFWYTQAGYSSTVRGVTEYRFPI